MNQQLWKKAGLRALVGAPLGLAYSTMITIIISLARGDGSYFAVVPEMIADIGSESVAVLLHAVRRGFRGRVGDMGHRLEPGENDGCSFSDLLGGHVPHRLSHPLDGAHSGRSPEILRHFSGHLHCHLDRSVYENEKKR